MAIVRYWAGAQAAAGRAEEAIPAGTVGELLAEIAARHDTARVWTVCSLLVDGVAVRREDTGFRLGDAAVVDLLPPFAGG